MKKPNESKLEDRQPPVTYHTGKDEMNFLEHTFSGASTRPSKSPDELVFRRVKADPSTSATITQRLSISFSTKFGRPTVEDDEVYVGLLAVTHQRIQEGLKPECCRIEFTRYELLNAIGWTDCGRSYRNVDRAINRLGGVWVVSDNAFFDREAQSWVDAKFHVINESHLFTREKYDQAVTRAGSRPKSWIEWGGPLIKSIRDGNLATFDLETYRNINGGVTKKLYRYSNKRLYKKRQYVIDLRELAEDKLGYKPGQAVSELKRTLEPTFVELQQFGLRVNEKSSGRSTLITISKSRMKSNHRQSLPAASGLEKELIERGVDRVGKKSASKLVALRPSDHISRQIENYDDRRKNGEDITVGWLIAAIESENGFGFRKGFKSSAHRTAEAAKKAQRQKELAETKAREEKKHLEQRASEEAARQRFQEFRARFSEAEQIELEDRALTKCDNMLIRAFVVRDRRAGEVSSWHQMLWEQYIMPTIA